MDFGLAGQWATVIGALLFIAWLYRQVCKEEPMEIPDYARGSLKVVRSVGYDDRDLREPNDSAFHDDYERPLPPAA